MIELKHIQFSYSKGKKLFEDLDLSIRPGSIYGLLGRNGAGKSTLLKHVCGMLYTDSGECTVFGIESKDRLPQMLQDIYIVPEEFQMPDIKLNLYTKLNSVFYPKFSQQLMDSYIKEFELPENEKLSKLSYGQKKKFLIAFGLATNARVLIFDEPTNGLDIPSKSQFRKIIASSLDENRIFIISTHQVRDLENLIDTIVILEQGKIIFNHSVAAISEKLAFEQNLNGYSADEILYSEEITGKKSGILRNQSGMETRIDLELLFNGVMKNSNSINASFNQ
jgi:ABC-2 type transport system ATP-binding protein